MVVATPSGVTLAPEGGAHQSIGTPLIGMAQDGLAAFEPAFVDELAAIMAWGFAYMQRDGSTPSETDWLRDRHGGSVYLRLSTRPIEQTPRQHRCCLAARYHRRRLLAAAAGRGRRTGHRLQRCDRGRRRSRPIAFCWRTCPGAGLLAVTSADRLNAGWHAAERDRQGGHGDAIAHVEALLAPLARDAGLVTVLDGHPGALSWLGAVRGHRVQALGVEHFGQSGDIPDLYRRYRIDTEAILDACAASCLAR